MNLRSSHEESGDPGDLEVSGLAVSSRITNHSLLLLLDPISYLNPRLVLL